MIPHVERYMGAEGATVLRTERTKAGEWEAGVYHRIPGRQIPLLACEGETLAEALQGLDELARDRLRRSARPGA